jgi:hypothetical protein
MWTPYRLFVNSVGELHVIGAMPTGFAFESDEGDINTHNLVKFCEQSQLMA